MESIARRGCGDCELQFCDWPNCMPQPEPTFQAVLAAFNSCCLAAAFPGEKQGALKELAALRRAKTTWIGQQENTFRHELDRYLKERGCTP